MIYSFGFPIYYKFVKMHNGNFVIDFLNGYVLIIEFDEYDSILDANLKVIGGMGG